MVALFCDRTQVTAAGEAEVSHMRPHDLDAGGGGAKQSYDLMVGQPESVALVSGAHAEVNVTIMQDVELVVL